MLFCKNPCSKYQVSNPWNERIVEPVYHNIQTIFPFYSCACPHTEQQPSKNFKDCLSCYYKADIECYYSQLKPQLVLCYVGAFHGKKNRLKYM